MQAQTTTKTKICTFRLGEFLCGIEVEAIQEVLRFQSVTEVPLARGEVTGLINLRGRIVTAIDLRQRLGLSEERGKVRPMNVVLRRDGGSISLLVDRIGDVVDLFEHEIEPAPETVEERFRRFVKGVYKLNEELLLVLDPELSSDPVTDSDPDENV